MSINFRKFIDIGANLTDPIFRGVYRGASKHADDFEPMLRRAWAHGVEKIIITAGSLMEARDALVLCQSDDRLFTTVGVHPTRCNELDEGQDGYLQDLLTLATSNRGKVVAIGECGLDWDRLQFCAKETQKRWFEAQFMLAERTGLPMFFHMRRYSCDYSLGDLIFCLLSCCDEFLEIVQRNRNRFSTGWGQG